MTGRTHRIAGATTGIVVSVATGTAADTWLPFIGAALLASTVPDWDIKLGIPHRGPTHFLLTGVALTGLLWWLAATLEAPPAAYTAAWGFLVGYTMHILADALTRAGVPLLGPFTTRDMHLLPKPIQFKTGQVLARHVLLTATIIIGIYGYLTIPHG